MSKPYTPKPPYPAQFREQMVELVRAGRKPSELAKEFGCHATSIMNWIRQADEASGTNASAGRCVQCQRTTGGKRLPTVNRLALSNTLPDAIITDTGLKITPQDTVVPDSAQVLIDQQVSSLLPRIKITELLMEVDEWTGFTRHFVLLKSDMQVKDKTLLLSAILADAINLGLTKMAESSPGASYSKLSWLQAWHIRDETFSAGLADLVNAQLGQQSLKPATTRLHGPIQYWRCSGQDSHVPQQFLLVMVLQYRSSAFSQSRRDRTNSLARFA